MSQSEHDFEDRIDAISETISRARLVESMFEALSEGDSEKLGAVFEDVHPADIADAVEELSDDQQSQFAELAPDILSGEVLAELDDATREDLFDDLEPKHIAEALIELESDDQIHVFEELDVDKREAVLAAVPIEDRESIEAGLLFDEESAGRLMQREFVAAPRFWTVGHTIDHMREAGEELPDQFFEIFVVDERFRPIGGVAISTLMRSQRSTLLSDILVPTKVILRPEDDQEDAAYLFEKYHLISAPVVDASERLTGMVTVDDIVEVIQEENTEDILALAGVNEAQGDTVLESVRARAPWLLVNLFTAVLASGVIALFDEAIAQLVALAVLMPIVASMGGNAGTQSLAVAVRAIASRDLNVSNTIRVVWRELAAGAVNGVIFAVVMGGVAALWFQHVQLGWVIGVAMIITLACAGLSGILIPLGLRRMGADPAVASSVFVTTVTDVVGFFVFLGLGALVLL